MEQFNIRVTSTKKVVLAVIITPMTTIFPVIILGALYGPVLPDWLLLTVIFVIMALGILVTLAIVKKISPEAVLTVYADGFNVDFLEKSFLTPASFQLKMDQITNYYSDEDRENYYMSFATSVRPAKFNLGARSKKDEDQASFLKLIDVITNMVAANNKQHAADAQVIAAVTIFERWWAKLIAAFVIIMFLLVLFFKLFMPDIQSPPWWKLSAMIVFGVPFIYKVYYHNYVKKKIS